MGKRRRERERSHLTENEGRPGLAAHTRGGVMRRERVQPYSSVAITPLHGLLYWENKQYPSTPQIRTPEKQGVIEDGKWCSWAWCSVSYGFQIDFLQHQLFLASCSIMWSERFKARGTEYSLVWEYVNANDALGIKATEEEGAGVHVLNLGFNSPNYRTGHFKHSQSCCFLRSFTRQTIDCI